MSPWHGATSSGSARSSSPLPGTAIRPRPGRPFGRAGGGPPPPVRTLDGPAPRGSRAAQAPVLRVASAVEQSPQLGMVARHAEVIGEAKILLAPVVLAEVDGGRVDLADL